MSENEKQTDLTWSLTQGMICTDRYRVKNGRKLFEIYSFTAMKLRKSRAQAALIFAD